MAPSTSAAAELVGEVRAKPASISERLASHPFVRALAAGEVSKDVVGAVRRRAALRLRR